MTEEEMTEEKKQEIHELKQEMMAQHTLGMAITKVIELMFHRWRARGWKEDKLRQFSITVIVEEEKKLKEKNTNNDKKAMFQ